MRAEDSRFAIHAGDFIAWKKGEAGAWRLDAETGEIISSHTGQPLKFQLGYHGYLMTRIYHERQWIPVMKHRAVWAMHYGIPIEYAFEVDHINGVRTDCRPANLRLLTHRENCRAGLHVLTMEQAEEIRQRYEESDVSLAELGRHYNCAARTIRRVVRYESYRRPQTESADRCGVWK